MRFTRYTATLLFILCVGGVVITAIVYLDALPFPAETLLQQLAYIFLLGLPFLMGFIGAIAIYSGRHSFIFSSLPPYEYASQDPPSERSAQDDPIIHLSIGMLVSLLQDFSQAMVQNRDIYAPQLLSMLEQELTYFRVYFDRGYSFHFNFHHEESYEAFVTYRLSQADIVIEVAGVFDYYFERGGQQHPTPHGNDINPPLLRVPAVMHLRLQHNAQTTKWQLVGFSDSIRGLKMGLATE